MPIGRFTWTFGEGRGLARVAHIIVPGNEVTFCSLPANREMGSSRPGFLEPTGHPVCETCLIYARRAGLVQE